MASPIRRLFQNPEKILSLHVTPRMRVLDVGSAMGFFSLPVARLVGPKGRVVCVDLQQKMLDSLMRRARRAQVLDRIEVRRCGADSLSITDLHGQIDLALVFAVVHEIGDPARLFAEVHDALRPGGRVLLAEPKGHVRWQTFDKTLSVAGHSGLRKVDTLRIPWSHGALLEKQGRAAHSLGLAA